MIYDPIKEGGEPRMDIDPRIKEGEEWSLSAAKFVYYQHQNSWLYRQQTKFPMLRRYAAGRQSVEQYKSIFFGDERRGKDGEEPTNEYTTLDEARKGFLHIDFERRFSPAPNMMSTLIGMMESQDHSIVVSAIDEKSQNDRQELKYKVQMMMLHKDLLQSAQAAFGEKADMLIPSSLEELSIYEQVGGFMLPYEIGLQEIIEYTMQYEGISKELKRRIIKDFVTLRMAAFIDKVNPTTGRIEWEYVDPSDIAIQYSEDSRFGDIWYWGRQKIYTVGDIRYKTGWSEEKIRNMAIAWNGNGMIENKAVDIVDDVSVYYGGQIPNYNDLRVAVFEYEYKTIDSKYTTKVKSPEGEFEVTEPYRRKGYRKPKIYDEEKRKTIADSYQTWYKGCWVIGTDYIYDYGRKCDQAFDFESRESRPSIHFYVLNTDKSIIEQAIPILDNISIMWYKYQNDIATSPPTNGLAIDVTSLQSITLNNKKLNPFDTLKIYNQSGKLLYSMHTKTAPGDPTQFNNVVPFKEIKGGIGAAVSDFVAGITNAYQQLSALTGIDQYTQSSATPSGELPVSTLKAVVSATKDTLRPLYSGWLQLLESGARNTALVGQYLCVYNKDESSGYYPILGRAKMEAIKAAGNTPPTYIGILINAAPTQQEINDVIAAAQAATAGGKNGVPAITMSEYLFIVDRLRTGAPIKDVMAYIAYKERQRDAMQQQNIQINQKMNMEAAQQTEALKQMAESKKVKQEADEKIRVAYYESMFKALSQIAIDKSWTVEQMKAQALKMGFDAASMQQEQQAAQGGSMGGSMGGMPGGIQIDPQGGVNK